MNQIKKQVDKVLLVQRNNPYFNFSHLMANLSKEKLITQRQNNLSSSLKPHYKTPLWLVRGEYQYLYDQQGTKYLDAYNNVAHVGHCHPIVTKKVCEQVMQLNTNTRYLHHHIVNLSQKLLSTLPKHLSKVFFVNSGSEANDLANRLAQFYTGKDRVLVLENSYHGTTEICAQLSANSRYVGSARQQINNVVAVPDLYRGAFKQGDERAGEKYALLVKDKIEELEENNQTVAGFLVESIQGVGGQVEYPKNYLKSVKKYLEEQNGILIADEVQTGFGRSGTDYWAFENQDVLPDIVTMGKAFGNGIPLAACVTTEEIAKKFSSLEYFNTFGGNPVSCAAGLAVIEVVENQRLQHNAHEVGTHFLAELNKLKSTFPNEIGDVRGRGLFLGIEFIQDKQTQNPDRDMSVYIMNELKDTYKIIVSLDGPYGTVLKIQPPMCFNKENADYFCKSLYEILIKARRTMDYLSKNISNN